MKDKSFHFHSLKKKKDDLNIIYVVFLSTNDSKSLQENNFKLTQVMFPRNVVRYLKNCTLLQY